MSCRRLCFGLLSVCACVMPIYLWRRGAAILLGEGYSEWALSAGSQFYGRFPLFSVPSFVMTDNRIIRRPPNRSGGSLLELQLCHLLGFLVLTYLTVHYTL